MKLLKLILFFLIINFGGLYIGSWLMNGGTTSSWYFGLNKAPWTPPGWVFGVAWTTIMICFSIYLGFLFNKRISLNKQLLYGLQVFLNVIWHYIFFNQQLVGPAFITIIALTYVIFYFFFNYKKHLKYKSFLLLPYMIWLLIATSLNAYILIYN